jgi:hypothetical protein
MGLRKRLLAFMEDVSIFHKLYPILQEEKRESREECVSLKRQCVRVMEETWRSVMDTLLEGKRVGKERPPHLILMVSFPVYVRESVSLKRDV